MPARDLARHQVTGIDMHIGSQITELQPFDDAFKLLRELVETLRPTATHRPRRCRRRPSAFPTS
jgi:diaminopimelate decarboxylase